MINHRHETALIRLAKIVIPVIIGLSTIILIGFTLDQGTRIEYWSLIAAYFFPPLGKESVIPTAIALGINPILISMSIAFVDSVVSLFMVWNYDLVKKIPLLGRFVNKVESLAITGSKKYAWVRPLKFIGIVLFVMVPFQGSGGVVGSILGRIIGMRSFTTWLAVTTGAVIGCLMVAYFTKIVFSNVILGISIALILAVVFVIIKMWKQSR